MSAVAALQRLVAWQNGWQARPFDRACANLEISQRARLAELLRLTERSDFGREHGLIHSVTYEELAKRLPVTDYSSWRERILDQRMSGRPRVCGEPVARYQPTSGSQSLEKWIPYSPTFLRELDSSIAPWLHDLASRYPRILEGSHYWSLSWMPDSLRDRGQDNNDLNLLPTWKRAVMARIMAVPDGVARAASSEDALFATAAFLVARSDLALISVWSPTFALGLVELIRARSVEIGRVLDHGDWGSREAAMRGLAAPKRDPSRAALLRAHAYRPEAELTRALWPQLALISAWDTSSSREWAIKLRQQFPHADFQGKALWATEGVVTIPYRGEQVLAVRSHFYEFKCEETGRVLPSWELQPGQVVQPILSTGSGLWRYALQDRLEVTGFYGATPTLTFLGRMDGTDLVGEKISTAQAASLVSKPLVCLVAIEGSAHPHYVAISEGGAAMNEQLALQVEGELRRSFHYRLARELGQLAHARVVEVPSGLRFIEEHARSRHKIAGNAKVDSLLRLPEDEFRSLVLRSRE